MIKINNDKDALLVVDVQNDFCPGGTLAVAGGDEVVPRLNAYMPLFKYVFTTQDWHPPNHISFAERGGPWPPHCIAGTRGAELHPDLKIENAIHIKKASDPDKEAYSGFEGTDLAQRLKDLGIKRVFIGGLTTDYCVKTTTLDARKNGFEAVVLDDAIRGIDAHPGDVNAAITEMKRAGAVMSRFNEITEAASRLSSFLQAF